MEARELGRRRVLGRGRAAADRCRRFVNNALTFLGIAGVIAVVGGLIVAIVHRGSESAATDGVDQFQRVMEALAPEEPAMRPTPSNQPVSRSGPGAPLPGSEHAGSEHAGSERPGYEG